MLPVHRQVGRTFGGASDGRSCTVVLLHKALLYMYAPSNRSTTRTTAKAEARMASCVVEYGSMCYLPNEVRRAG